MESNAGRQKRHLRLVEPGENPPPAGDIYRPETDIPQLPVTRSISVILAEAGVQYGPEQGEEFHPLTNQDFKEAVPARLKGRSTRIFHNIARMISNNTLGRPEGETVVPLEVLEVLVAPESDEPEARPRLERFIGMGPADTEILRSVIDHAKNPPDNAA